MEDLTPWLVELSERAQQIDVFARADEMKHPGEDHRGRRPKRYLPGQGIAESEVMDISSETSRVMPKGRNFQ